MVKAIVHEKHHVQHLTAPTFIIRKQNTDIAYDKKLAMKIHPHLGRY